MKKHKNSIFFILVIILVSIYYNYNDIILKKPQSVHRWRQSDCASIALNYYQNGMHFFKPETHNLTSDSGTSGACCTSEIPILYFSVAGFYSVFGYHDYIYRIFNTFLFLLGFFFLYRLIQYLLNDVFWSISLTILFFTSPVLVYYGNNYLSNSSALAFSIIGWYYFVRFSFERKSKWFYLSMVTFLIAGAFKVTALFSLFAISGIFFLELFGLLKLNKNEKLFNKPIQYISTLFSVFIILGSWIVYAHVFNTRHDCYYFSTTIFPIWDLDKAGIKGVLDNILNIWLYQYFHRTVLIFIALCFLFITFFHRKNNRLLFLSTYIIIFEAITYIILQFWTFADHDYYTIELYILPILIIINTFDILNRHFNKIFSSLLVKGSFSLFILFNIFYAKQKIDERYNGYMNAAFKNKDLYSITPYLRQLGISPMDTVISIPDGSHASLYLMNQKGWTEYTDARFNKGDKIYYNQDSAGIQRSIDKGAKYLIINGIDQLYKKEYLQNYCTFLTGNYKSVLIFNLKTHKKNFNVKERIVENIYTCNAELLIDDKTSFISPTDSNLLFKNGETRSNENAHSGMYSSKLDVNSPYGMTIKINNLRIGESIDISVWRKIINQSKGKIVVSSTTPDQYYNDVCKIIAAGSNGWEKLTMQVFISSELENQELVIYVFNPNTDPVYFDDFEIIRYKSIL